jgi:hypothetical protein
MLSKQANNFLKKLLHDSIRKPFLTIPLVGLISSLFLYVSRDSSYPTFFIITLLAWIASDFCISIFVGGGSGIGQIPLFGSKSQYKGLVFLAFFIGIFVVSVFINFVTAGLTQLLASFLSNPFVCLLVGFLLAGLVFADLQMKFYNRGKSR